MGSVNCILCGSTTSTLINQYKQYKMVRCTTCGLVYQKPQPGRERLMALYRTYHIRGGKVERNWRVLMKGIYSETAELLRNRFPAGGSILDVGCGFGHFLQMMKETGWETFGLDPSPLTLQSAIRGGVQVIETTFEDADLPEGRFDVVTMFYVLEHLHEPIEALRKARRILKPRGCLILRVPHTTPIVRLLSLVGVRNNLYDLPFHLFDFSPVVLEDMLKRTGFSEVEVFPGMPTVPHNISARVVSLISGHIARVFYRASGRRLLLPGVSKTATAIRPLTGDKG